MIRYSITDKFEFFIIISNLSYQIVYHQKYENLNINQYDFEEMIKQMLNC
jgi:hypothetical protein